MSPSQLTDLRKSLANWHQLLLDGLKRKFELEVKRPVSGAEWFQVLISNSHFSPALSWNSLIADVDILMESSPDVSQIEEAFQVVGFFVGGRGQENDTETLIFHLNQTDTELRLEWQRLSKLLGQHLNPDLTEAQVTEKRNAWRARQAMHRTLKIKGDS